MQKWNGSISTTDRPDFYRTNVFKLTHSHCLKQLTNLFLNTKSQMWVFLNSLNNPKFGASQNLKILIGIPPLDDPMTNLPKKNGWNSLQPPEMELQSLVPTESPSWHHISSRSPGHIHQRIWACHTSLERSRIAFYGYANLCPPNQTIWRLEASKAIQRCPWFAYIRRWDENFSHWVTSYTSLAFRKT